MTSRRLASTVLLVAAPIIVAVSAAWHHDAVPDPLPTHWDLHGHVDGSTGLAEFTIAVLLVTLTAALVGLVLVWQRARARAAAGPLFGWLAWLFAMLYAGTMVASAGAARAEDVDLPWWLLVVALGVPGIVGLALFLLLPPRPETIVQPTPALELAPGERAVWFGSARSIAMAWIGVACALVGAVMLFFAPLPGVVLLVVGAVGWWMHLLTVRVDGSGVRAVWGPLGWPGRTVRLADIVAAEAIELDPMQWGGWGYRLSPRGTALVVRRGPAIVVRRRGAGALAVTVDGADEAAALLNALVEHAGAASG